MPAETANSNSNVNSSATANNNAISTHMLREKNSDEAMEVDQQIVTDTADILQSVLEFAFGVSIDDNNGIAQEFSSSPELLLQLQDSVRTILTSLCLKTDEVSQSLLLDELIFTAVNLIKPSNGFSSSNSIPNSDDSLAVVFPQRNLPNSFIASSAFDYLIGTRKRCNVLLDQSKHIASTALLILLEKRIMAQTILFLRGLLSESCSYDEVSTLLFRRLLSDELDSFFMRELILRGCDFALADSSAIGEVFNPVLTLMKSCFLIVTAELKFTEFVVKIFSILKKLLDVKLENNTRPIAELIVFRPDFHPKKLLSKNVGREFLASSFLGPFFNLSIVGGQSFDLCFENASTAFQGEKLTELEKEQSMTSFRVWLANLRLNLHSVVHALVVNSSTRHQTLDYFFHILTTNRKLSQLHADFSQLANCTSVLNVFSVILLLSDKIVIEKVQSDYLFHPKCRIDTTDESRINMDSEKLESYRKELAELTYVPNFNTECFYLGIEFMRISVNAMSNAFSRLKRFYLSDLRRRVQEMEERMNALGNSANPAQVTRIKSAMRRAKEMLKQFNLSAYCYECLLYDPNLVEMCVLFTNKLLRMLLHPIMPVFGQNEFQPDFDRFFAFPETYLEVAVEFLTLLVSKSKMSRIFLKNLSDFPKQVLHLLLNLESIKNPFIGSKVVDLLFMLCPLVNHDASVFYRQIVSDSLAVEGLFPSLVKFYSAVETTGSHTEFFDKFNIRRNIQVIFKCMWSDLSHRDRMVQYAGEFSPSFVRFINMVLNDTTFLLDESLDKLKMIHDIESVMSNETEWDKLSQEEQQLKTDQLRDSKGQVKMWIQLGTDTMELFVTLTSDAPQIFRNEALGERVAAMLNHNLVQLCGPKCARLKVHDAINRFEWDPRTLTQQIVKVYINLGSEMFAKQIAQDERSYTPEAFSTIIERFKMRNILTINHLELFANLAEQAEAAYKEKMMFEEEFEDEVPEEFKDFPRGSPNRQTFSPLFNIAGVIVVLLFFSNTASAQKLNDSQNVSSHSTNQIEIEAKKTEHGSAGLSILEILLLWLSRFSVLEIVLWALVPVVICVFVVVCACVISRRRPSLRNELLRLIDLGHQIQVVDGNIYRWKVKIPGPPTSLYFPGVYTVNIEIPCVYPNQAPKVQFETRILHPNIKNGDFCVNLLTLWNASNNMTDVLQAISHVLLEPNYESPYNTEAAFAYRHNQVAYENSVRRMVQLYAVGG